MRIKKNYMLQFFSALMAFGILFTSCIGTGKDSETNNIPVTTVSFNEREKYLFESTISKVLQDELWNRRDQYDACHYLMVPMHMAFRANEVDFVKQFSEHFKRFMDSKYSFSNDTVLSKLHYMYLASQFMVLCHEYGYSDLIPEKLFTYIKEDVFTFYKSFTGPWGGYKDIDDRLDFIINTRAGSTNSLDRAITDFEFLAMAILCDIYNISESFDVKIDPDSKDTLYSLTNKVYILFQQEAIISSDGSWVLQPGAWSSHQDYRYAGNAEIVDNLQEAIVPAITMDSSHFHRMPLLLHSYQSAQASQQKRHFFDSLIAGLAIQFKRYVLLEPTASVPYYRLNNFMNGNNGVFRYSYNEDKTGYGPYELSATFLLGWWTFLNDADVHAAYRFTSDKLSSSKYAEHPYYDPVTVREQNMYFGTKGGLSTGLFELITSLASK